MVQALCPNDPVTGCGGDGIGVGEGVTDGVGVGVADADAEAEAVAFAVVDAACDALLAAWLLLVDDVQPDTSKDADKSKRTTITAIGFNCMRLYKW